MQRIFVSRANRKQADDGHEHQVGEFRSWAEQQRYC
jgi:hypothetical protein